jgi:hypothetical protein
VGLVIYGSKTLSKDALKRFETNIFSKTISNMKKWFLEFF